MGVKSRLSSFAFALPKQGRFSMLSSVANTLGSGVGVKASGVGSGVGVKISLAVNGFSSGVGVKKS